MCSGYQSTRLVGGQQPVAQLRGADVPGRLGVVEQRRAAAPAVRVGVQQRLGAQQPPARAQVLDQVGVGVLDPAAGVRADALVVGAVGPHGVDDVEPCSAPSRKSSSPNAIAVCTMPGAVLGGHEVAGQHGVALLAVLGRGDERERRLVARAEHVAPVEAVDDLGALAEHALDQRLGEHVAVERAHVGEVGVDGHRGVRRRASTAWSSRPAARRPRAARRRARSPGSARRSRGPRRPRSPARPRARRARCRRAGSRGRPCGPRRAGPRSHNSSSAHQTDST